MVGPSKEIQRSLLSLGSSQPQRRSLLSTMFSRGGHGVKMAKATESGYFLPKSGG